MSNPIPYREFDDLSGVSVSMLMLMHSECLEELQAVPVFKRVQAASRNGLTEIRNELQRRRALETPQGVTPLSGEAWKANTEAPAVSREVGRL